MKIDIPHRLRLARTPTPIQKLTRLSEHFQGPTVYVKRDDLTGFGLSGNKVRKLEFSIADARQNGCDTLITTGGLGSNHARATAVAARQLGLEPFLVLRGEPGPVADGNYFLDTLLDAKVKFITEEEYEHNEEIMEEVSERLKSEGRKPYIIPEGASNEIGAWGYFAAADEIRGQLLEEDLPEFDGIVIAVGSGGTQAGLLLGLQYHQMDIPVFGINVCDDEDYFRVKITKILKSFGERYAYPLPLPVDDIRIIDGYVGAGYALSRPEEIEVIRLVARLEGILLDPVYTAKAMYGLLEESGKGRFHRNMNLLFIHTGGAFGLFPKRQVFAGESDTG
ncbi:MAG: D-cysteine desulfhydrase family protein [bacterium]